MPFADIIEQETAKRRLTLFLERDRVPGALLFHGPWGVGKTRAALTFARALNCETGDGDACDRCPSCRKALGFAHPDIRFVFPMPRSQKQGRAAEEEEEGWEADELRAMSTDPLHIIQFERNATIWIDKTREVRRQSAMACAEGRRKVFVLREADRMRDDQANSILKILEEPSASTHFILTSSRPLALLPTIVSRCQSVAFGPLGRSAIAGVLEEHTELEPAAIRLAAALAQGSLGRALLMADEDVRKLRDQALALLDAALRGGPHLHAAAATVAGEKDRTLIRRLAHALAVWHGDLLSVRYGLDRQRIANVDRLEALERQAAAIDIDEIRRRLELCEELRVAMEQNVSHQIAIYWLLASLADPAAAAERLLAET